jgi:hypothetical protein
MHQETSLLFRTFRNGASHPQATQGTQVYGPVIIPRSCWKYRYDGVGIGIVALLNRNV